MVRVMIVEDVLRRGEVLMGECCNGVVNAVLVRVMIVEDVLLGRGEVL